MNNSPFLLLHQNYLRQSLDLTNLSLNLETTSVNSCVPTNNTNSNNESTNSSSSSPSSSPRVHIPSTKSLPALPSWTDKTESPPSESPIGSTEEDSSSKDTSVATTQQEEVAYVSIYDVLHGYHLPEQISIGVFDMNAFKKRKKNFKQILLQNVLKVKEYVDREFLIYGPEAQFKRDGYMWFQTLSAPGSEQRGNILRRIFTVLRYGGLLYRHKKPSKSKRKSNANESPEVEQEVEEIMNSILFEEANPSPNTNNTSTSNFSKHQWTWWYERNWPIASVLSHGGRVVIQLPNNKNTSTQHDHSFWRWLLTGDENGDLNSVVSTCTSGDQCSKENRLVFRRVASHALSYKKGVDGTAQQNSLEEESDFTTELKEIENLPCGRVKLIHEVKVKGFNFRDSKLLSSQEHTLKHHRHWGCNIPMNGCGSISPNGTTVEADGSYGHLYFYVMAPRSDRCGGIMIGLEGSEFGKMDATGVSHTISAKSNPFSPTFGYKWHSKVYKDLGSTVKGPGKYDCMFVDLTKGWQFLIEKYKREWRDEFVMQTCLPVQEDPNFIVQQSLPRQVNLRSRNFVPSWKRSPVVVEQRVEEPVQSIKYPKYIDLAKRQMDPRIRFLYYAKHRKEEAKYDKKSLAIVTVTPSKLNSLNYPNLSWL